MVQAGCQLREFDPRTFLVFRACLFLLLGFAILEHLANFGVLGVKVAEVLLPRAEIVLVLATVKPTETRTNSAVRPLTVSRSLRLAGGRNPRGGASSPYAGV